MKTSIIERERNILMSLAGWSWSEADEFLSSKAQAEGGAKTMISPYLSQRVPSPSGIFSQTRQSR